MSGEREQAIGRRKQDWQGGPDDISVSNHGDDEMAPKRKRRQWMIDDPNVPESAGPRDLLVQLPSGDKVSVRSVFWGS